MAGHDSVRHVYPRSFPNSARTDVSDYTDRSAAFGPISMRSPDDDRSRALIARDRGRGATLPAGTVRLRGHRVIVAEFEP